MNRTTGWKVVAGAAALALVGAGCGDDDEDAGTASAPTEAADPNAEYCALAQELDQQDEVFTTEQIEQLQEAAPDAIREEIDAVAPIFIEAIEAGDPFAAFEDPVVGENIEAIETFEAEECGLGDDGEPGADEGAAPVEIAPENEEYCAIATELDSQESFPSIEQMEAIRAAAPEVIADEINVVVDAIVAAGDDPFAAFEDPEVDAAFGPIEDFEEEFCGIDHSDGEDEEAEQDPSVTEPDESAAQVSVTATEYAFAVDPAPASGRTQFTMTNQGEERHVMLVFKIAEGSTMEDVLGSEGDEGVEEEFESDSAAAGEQAILTLDLTSGDWGMVCYIPTADGTPHYEEGMQTEFTVE